MGYNFGQPIIILLVTIAFYILYFVYSLTIGMVSIIPFMSIIGAILLFIPKAFFDYIVAVEIIKLFSPQ